MPNLVFVAGFGFLDSSQAAPPKPVQPLLPAKPAQLL